MIKRILKSFSAALVLAVLTVSVCNLSLVENTKNQTKYEVIAHESEFCFDGIRPQIIDGFDRAKPKTTEKSNKKIGMLEFLKRIKSSAEGRRKVQTGR